MIRLGATGTALVLAGLVTAGRAEAETCRPIEGTVTTEQTSASCASPVGICFAGTLRSNSWLRGSTSFVVTSAAPSSTDPTTLVYTGTLAVTLPGGAVVTYDTTGSVDQLTGAFVEADVAQDGSGTLAITGTTNSTLSAFRGAFTGEICGGAPPAR